MCHTFFSNYSTAIISSASAIIAGFGGQLIGQHQARKTAKEIARHAAFWQLFVAAAKEFKEVWEPIRAKFTENFIENPPTANNSFTMQCAITILYVGDITEPETSSPWKNLHKLHNSIRYYLPKDKIEAFDKAAEDVLGKGDKVNPHDYLEARTIEKEKEMRIEILKRLDRLIRFSTNEEA